MVDPKLQTILLAALLAIAGYLCFTIVQPFLMPLVAATALAILFYPAHLRLEKRGWSRGVAAGLAVALVVYMTLIPAGILALAATRELRDLYALLAKKSSAGGGWEPWLTDVLQRPFAWFGIDVDDPDFRLKSAVLEWAQSGSSTLVKVIRGAVSNTAVFIFDSVITLFALFFLFRDGRQILAYIRETAPLPPEYLDRLFDEVGRTVIANMYGVVAVAVVQGGLTGLAFWILGISTPVLWGVVAGLCSMIPLMGPPIVWIPGAIYLGSSGHWGKAAVLAGIGLGVIGLADNFIRPYVISGQVKLHPLLIFFALLGGAQSFGLMGLFIGPAAVAVTMALLEMLRGHAVAEPPIE